MVIATTLLALASRAGTMPPRPPLDVGAGRGQISRQIRLMAMALTGVMFVRSTL